MSSIRNRVKYVLVHVPVVVWMIVIFCFSAQPGDESADLSGGISHMFMSILNKVFALGWEESYVLELAGIWDFPIRKLAHMTEFGILAVLIFVAIQYYNKINTAKKRYISAWIGAVGYAATDEFHQLFVQGRSGNLFDVCVDALGITFALIVIYFLRRIYGRIRQL